MNLIILSYTSLTTFTYPKDLHNFEDSITEIDCVLTGVSLTSG